MFSLICRCENEREGDVLVSMSRSYGCIFPHGLSSRPGFAIDLYVFLLDALITVIPLQATTTSYFATHISQRNRVPEMTATLTPYNAGIRNSVTEFVLKHYAISVKETFVKYNY